MAKPKRSESTTSIRLSPQLAAELELRAASGIPRSELINRFALEGLRMDAHPGIVFRAGPAGRRPGLVGGPDVWEVARLLREVEPRGEAAIPVTAEATGLTVEQVTAALNYYAAFRDEIDEWIEDIDREAEWMEQAWRQRADVLA
jgi:hypothetical protein